MTPVYALRSPRQLVGSGRCGVWRSGIKEEPKAGDSRGAGRHDDLSYREPPSTMAVIIWKNAIRLRR